MHDVSVDFILPISCLPYSHLSVYSMLNYTLNSHWPVPKAARLL